MLRIIILLLSFDQALAFRHMVSCLILEKVLCLQESPNHHASNTVLHSWYTEFVLMCSVWFLPNMALDLSPNISTLVSSVQSTMFNKSCDWFSCSFLNYNPCCHVLFLERRGSWQPVKKTCSVHTAKGLESKTKPGCCI